MDTWDGMGWFGMFGGVFGGALGPFGKLRTFWHVLICFGIILDFCYNLGVNWDVLVCFGMY